MPIDDDKRRSKGQKRFPNRIIVRLFCDRLHRSIVSMANVNYSLTALCTVEALHIMLRFFLYCQWLMGINTRLNYTYEH